MKKHIDELTNQELYYWVAKSFGWKQEHVTGGSFGSIGCLCWVPPHGRPRFTVAGYDPTVSWEQCGPLIKQFKLIVSAKSCYSTTSGRTWVGDTPQIAICKAVISGKYGEFVEGE